MTLLGTMAAAKLAATRIHTARRHLMADECRLVLPRLGIGLRSVGKQLHAGVAADHDDGIVMPAGIRWAR